MNAQVLQTTGTTEKAVFVSYASEDSEAAAKICVALLAAGVDVWFDQSELRGGDTWDAAIMDQIKTAALFIPVISANTDARLDGYFRREWSLAIDCLRQRGNDAPFLLPVVIDATSDAAARTPDEFRGVPWTRLRHGKTPSAFVNRVMSLLVPTARSAAVRGSTSRPSLAIVLTVALLAIAAYLILKHG